MANNRSNYPDFVFITYDEDFSAQTHEVVVSLEAGSLVGVPVKYVRNDLNTRPAAPVEGLETVAYRHMDTWEGAPKYWKYHERDLQLDEAITEELVTRSQAEAIIAAKDRLLAASDTVAQQLQNQIVTLTLKKEDLEADNAALTARVKELGGNLEFADKSLAREVSLTASFEAKLAEALAAAKLVEDWWLSEGVKHFDVTPCCFFATRSVMGGKTS